MLAPRNEATVWPAFAVSSSVIVISDGADAVRTGASLVPVMVIVKGCDVIPPSPSLIATV